MSELFSSAVKLTGPKRAGKAHTLSPRAGGRSENGVTAEAYYQNPPGCIPVTVISAHGVHALSAAM